MIIGGEDRSQVDIIEVTEDTIESSSSPGPDLPEAVWSMQDSVVVDPETGNVYVVGGMGTSGIRDKVLMYNATLSEWFPLPSLLYPMSVASAFLIGTTLYVTGGQFDTNIMAMYADFMYYLDLLDTESGWIWVTDLPSTRYLAASCILDGKAWLSGGYTFLDPHSTISDDLLMWEPGKQWQSMHKMLGPHAGHTMTTDGTFLYVIGGNSDGDARTEVYYPQTDSWIIKTPIPGQRFGIGAVYVSWGEIIVPFGSSQTDSDTDNICVYNISSDEWRIIDVMASYPKDFGVAVIPPPT